MKRTCQSILFAAAVAACCATAVRAQIPVEAWPIREAVLPPEMKIIRDVKYGPHPQHVLDIMQPPGDARSLRPGAIVIHGGGWVGGMRNWVAEHACLRFLQKGFVVANVEYRLAKVAKAPAAVEDVLLAAGWIERNAKRFGIDRKRIVVTGDSAGGHLALMVGMTPESAGLGRTGRVRAVVNFFGITDVGDQLDGKNRRKYTVEWVPEQPGRFELAARVSPVTYVRKKLPAILTIHGTADPSVPYDHAVRLRDAMERAGARGVLITIANGGHGFPLKQTDEIYDRYVWPFLVAQGLLDRKLAGPVPPEAAGACSPESRCAFLTK